MTLPSAAATSPAPELPSQWPVDLCRAVLGHQPPAVDGPPVPAGPTLELWRPRSRRIVRDAAFLATGLARTGESGEADPDEAAPTSRESTESSESTLPQPATFAHIVSVAGLIHFADLPLALRGIGYLLAPGGVVDLVEPISAPGLRAFVAASVVAGLGRWVPEVRDVHLHRDVPVALRAEGFTLATIDRFTVETPVRPLRTWTRTRAVRIAPSGAGGTERGSAS
jgi:hypothetical protein